MKIADAQRSYLKRLLIEAFSHRYPSVYDYNHLGGAISRADASAEIERLKSAKERGWPKEALPSYTTGPWDHLSAETRARYCVYRKTEPMAHVAAWRAWHEEHAS